ncbi:MAG: hemolysin family protein [Thermodesulfobacteriota bacterium]
MQDVTLVQNLLFLLLLLFLSGFFSMSEGALFSLGKHQRSKLRKEGKKTATLIERLLKEPYKLIITIHLSDEILNVIYSSVVALTVRAILHNVSDEAILTLISIGIASPTLLLLGEIGPKTIGVKFPRLIASLVAYPLNLYHLLITPLRWIVLGLSVGITWLFGGGGIEYESKEGLSDGEMKALLGLGSEEGVVTEIEKKLVSKLFKLEEVPVYKIMTPAIDCFFLPVYISPEDAIYRVKKRGLSRIPIYKNERENIIGILYTKDLLSLDSSQEKTIEGILRPPYFIPRSKRAFDLLREFQHKRTQIAIVVEEYGRVDGIVTMEDILEELFGEIEDERRAIKETQVVWEGDALIVPGSMKIDEFNDKFLFTLIRTGGLKSLGAELDISVLPPQEDHETIGGFLFDLFGRFPQEGEQVEHGSLLFTVNKVTGKRISEVKVQRSEKEVSYVA